MPETVTFKGQTLHLEGTLVKEGQIAPDCELVSNNLKNVRLSSYKGKVTVLLSVPSLDTPVCSTETRHFNVEMEKLKDQLTVICVSMDLPFAQTRWCGAEGIKNVITLSDYKLREFGKAYGVYIAEIGLLARTVFILDPSMKIAHLHLVKEITQEPDYATINQQVHDLLATAKK